jgi:hypothetical protein
MLKRLAAAAMLGVFVLPIPSQAGEAGDILREALYTGALDEGLNRLAPLLKTDQEASFGTGFIYFVQGIEGLAQALYRHGLAAPETGPMGPPLLVPVEPNPNPEPLDYEKVRGILEPLVNAMDAASEELQLAGERGDYVVEIDILKIRIDANGDGTSEEGESIGQVIARAFGTDPSMVAPPPVTEPAPDKKGESDKAGKTATATPKPETPAVPQAVIGFDRADAIWLAGYSQVFAAQADFLLAHNFETTVNATFHRLFPKAGLPMQDVAGGSMLMLDPQSDNAIADFVAAIHTINWPVVEPDRLKRVLTRFQSITELSRRNWEAILAETDDNHELVPNPQQVSLVPEGKVTDEVVAAWMETLDTADKILAGELLVPHWRFKQGFDLKAYFETATHFDLVMMLTGYDSRPFLKDGPVATADSFAAANRVFGDEFLGYVFWFN